MSLAWTTELPREPGWYWMRISSCEPWLVEVRARRVGLVVDHGYRIERYEQSDAVILGSTREWSGPLIPPEEP